MTKEAKIAIIPLVDGNMQQVALCVMAGNSAHSVHIEPVFPPKGERGEGGAAPSILCAAPTPPFTVFTQHRIVV